MASSRDELEKKIDKFEVNMTRTDRIVNGTENEDVIVDGGQLVPSIRKWQKEMEEEYGVPPQDLIDAVNQSKANAVSAEESAQQAVAAAGQVEQNAEQIAQEAAEQAVQDVVAGVDGRVATAVDAADRAETASEAAFVNADVYSDVASGLAAVADGDQFQVVEGDEIVRYRRDSASAQTEMASYPSAHAVLEPSRAGKLAAWPDTFFRDSEVGVDFFGRKRWREVAGFSFSSATIAPQTIFNGRSFRKIKNGLRCGPLIWLDEIGAGPGDTVTIYGLFSSLHSSKTCYFDGFFYTEAGTVSGAAISQVSGVSDSGATELSLTSQPKRLRITAVVPAGAAAIAITPTSFNLQEGESFDTLAIWGFKGSASAGPMWPDLDHDAYGRFLGRENANGIRVLSGELAGTQEDIQKVAEEIESIPRGLFELKMALTDPLTQYLGVVLLGDSITWGSGASGTAEKNPRSGTLSDARNNGSSKTWANLLHKYLGIEYYEDNAATEKAWPGSPSGVAIFEYERAVNLFPGYPPFESINANAGTPAGSWAQVSHESSRLGFCWEGVVSSSADRMSLSWTMTGREFDLVFAVLGDGAAYRLIIDGELEGVYSTQAGDTGIVAGYGNVRTHSLGGFRKNAKIEMELIPGDPYRKRLRLECIQVNRKLRVTNQGINGTSAARYRSGNIAEAAVQADDMFALIQLGTNDRAILRSFGMPEGVLTLRQNMEAAADVIESKGVTPIVLCANAVTDDYPPTYKYKMSDVRAILRQFAIDRGYSFIDQFAITRPLIASGDTSFLADGLHPSDIGHGIMFENIKRSIDGE